MFEIFTVLLLFSSIFCRAYVKTTLECVKNIVPNQRISNLTELTIIETIRIELASDYIVCEYNSFICHSHNSITFNILLVSANVMLSLRRFVDFPKFVSKEIRIALIAKNLNGAYLKQQNRPSLRHSMSRLNSLDGTSLFCVPTTWQCISLLRPKQCHLSADQLDDLSPRLPSTSLPLLASPATLT